MSKRLYRLESLDYSDWVRAYYAQDIFKVNLKLREILLKIVNQIPIFQYYAAYLNLAIYR